jgi:glycosyltransferase involved in cell wall biosynthesis
LNTSLCVVLPVRNAQENLADFAGGLLEVLPELSARFELLLIDNGSQDATSDVARELARSYPQVRLARYGMPIDLAGIVRIATSQSRCQHILLCDEGCRLELRDLHKLWRSRDDYDAVLAWPAGAGAFDEEACGQRVRALRLRLARPETTLAKQAVPGYQLLQRRVLETLRWVPRDRYEMLSELSRHGFRWQVVEVRLAQPLEAARSGRSMRVDEHAAAIPAPLATRAARSLEAIREFARGE